MSQSEPAHSKSLTHLEVHISTATSQAFLSHSDRQWSGTLRWYWSPPSTFLLTHYYEGQPHCPIETCRRHEGHAHYGTIRMWESLACQNGLRFESDRHLCEMCTSKCLHVIPAKIYTPSPSDIFFLSKPLLKINLPTEKNLTFVTSPLNNLKKKNTFFPIYSSTCPLPTFSPRQEWWELCSRCLLGIHITYSRRHWLPHRSWMRKDLAPFHQ